MHSEIIKESFLSVLYAWTDSLTWLCTKSIKLALFGVYRALINSYWVLATKFFWVPCMIGIIDAAIVNPFLHTFLLNMTIILWAMVTVIAVRPSVGLKSSKYFIHFGYVGIALSILVLIILALEPCLTSIFGFFSLARGIYSPLFFCCAFFVSDCWSAVSSLLQGCKYGIKMVVYNYPLFVLVHGIIFVVGRLVHVTIIPWAYTYLFVVFGSATTYYIYMLLLPAYACVMNSIYIQRRHEQRELYKEG